MPSERSALVLAPFDEVLPDPGSGRPPVCAFTCYGLETAVAVLQAAERRSAPTMFLVSAGTYRSTLGRPLVRALLAVADAAATPVAVQLDHVTDLEVIAAALEDGVQAVMADGSKLRYEDNLAFVTAATRLARLHGAQVEVELGHVAGDEERATGGASSGLTDPGEAEAFAAASGAACLAVSIGNVHGRYAAPPVLDVQRLREIEARTDIPLSLHGASGLPTAQLSAVLGGAIAKINVNTELRQRYVDVVSDRLPSVHEALDLLTLGTDVVAGVADAVGEKLDAVTAMTRKSAA
jgi:tagatose 1,6-diphosphate aldolase GatY/KbaY